MKAYGVPRFRDTESPDKADIKYYGFSTEDRCSRADRGKNEARLHWKKKERRRVKNSIRKEIEKYFLD